jgi:pimeloyl-ACP methyl ester carboxylesterase
MVKQLLSFLFFVQVFPAVAQQNSQPAGESADSLRVPGGILYGTLAIPPSKEPVPVVLIIAGSGATDRDGNSPGLKMNIYRMLADSLLRHGIASLRYDKRGVGQSVHAMRSEADVTFITGIDDAVAWLRSLKTDRRFSVVVVLGHSEGSLVGMMAAKEGNADGYISVSGAGEPIDKILNKQLRQQAPQLAEKAAILLDSLSKGFTVQEPGGTLNGLFRASVQPYMISWIKLDPLQEIKKLTIPILILQGRTDIQVSVEDAEGLKTASPAATLVLIDSMSHILKQGPADKQKNMATYFMPNLPLKPELVGAIDDFVLHRVKRTRPI